MEFIFDSITSGTPEHMCQAVVASDCQTFFFFFAEAQCHLTLIISYGASSVLDLFIYFLFYVYGCFACVYVCIPHAVSVQARRGCWIL